MLICGSYMFECSVRKDMKRNKITMKKENSNMSSSIFSNTNYQEIEY